MALLDAVSCDLQSTGEFSSTTIPSGGSIAFVTTGLWVGQSAIQILPGTLSDTTAEVTFGSNLAQFCVRFLYRVTDMGGLTGSTSRFVGRIRPATGATQINIHELLTTSPFSRSIEILSGSTSLAIHDHSDLTDGDWVWIQVAMNDVSNANSWRVETRSLKEAGAYRLSSGTNAAVVGNWDALVLFAGPGTVDETVANQIIVDDSFVADYPPEYVLQVMRPTTDVSTQWTTVGSGASNAARTAETPPDAGTTGVNSNTTSVMTDIYELENLYAPSGGGVVAGILVGMQARNSVGSTRTMTIAMLDGLNNVISESAAVTPNSAAYGFHRKVLFSTSSNFGTKDLLDGYRIRIRAATASLTANQITVSALWVVAVVNVKVTSNDSQTSVETVPALTNAIPTLTDASTSLETAPDGTLTNTFVVVDDLNVSTNSVLALTNTFTGPDTNSSEDTIPTAGVTAQVPIDESTSGSDVLAVTNTFAVSGDDNTSVDNVAQLATDLGTLQDENVSEDASAVLEFSRAGSPDIIFVGGKPHVKLADPDQYLE